MYCWAKLKTSLLDHELEEDDGLLLLPPLPKPGILIIASAELAMDKMRKSCATVWNGRIFIQCRLTKISVGFESRVAVKTRRREIEIWKDRKELASGKRVGD
jgi:hypothetical protein